MTTWFIDTSYLVAFVSPADEAHPLATKLGDSFQGTLVTTHWVLLEFANALSNPKTRTTALGFIDWLQANMKVSILPASADRFTQGLDLYRKRSDKDWSLTDCISFVVMKELHLTEALTADHHFEQAGFTALLKENQP